MPFIIFGLCIVLLIIRIHIGVDLMDESYYASFIDGWLKTGIANSQNLMLHQTADLIVYPLAKLYCYINKSEEGLVLFLRYIYLCISIFSSYCVYRAMLLKYSQWVSMLLATFVLLFVPFGLPAPSYNTMGMYFLTAALSLFLISITNITNQTPRWIFIVSLLSALCWGITCVAYCTMISVFFMLILLSFSVLHSSSERRVLNHYILLCSAVFILFFCILYSLLGRSRLLEMFYFTNSFNNISGSFFNKIKMIAIVFKNHKHFAMLVAAGIGITAYESRYFAYKKNRLLIVLVIIFFIFCIAEVKQPIFFLHSHDLIFMLAMIGCIPACRILFCKNSGNDQYIFPIVYLTSFFAGIVSTLTASNGLYNFPIGGQLAACLALAMLIPPRDTIHSVYMNAISITMLGAASGVMAQSSLTFFYGQIMPLSYHSSVRITDGLYKGIVTDADDSNFIMAFRHELESEQGKNFAVLGSTAPGYYLLTNKIPITLSTWNFSGNPQCWAAKAIKNFYQNCTNQPDVLVYNSSQFAPPFSESDLALLSKYKFVKKITIGHRMAFIYVKVNDDKC